MRFRGLPRDLNCGPVDLELASPGNTGPLLPPCGPCGFVSVSYYVLSGCGHVVCDSCAFIFPERVNDQDEEKDHACCSVCDDTSLAVAMNISVSALDKTTFRCPCGTQGTLKELRQHRRACRVTEPSPEAGPADSGAEGGDSSVSSSSSGGSSASRHLDTEIVSSKVKEILLEELQRVEEDILNRTEIRRTPLQTQSEALTRRIQDLERQIARMRADPQRPTTSEPVSPFPPGSLLEIQRNTALIRTLQQQVSHLAVNTAPSEASMTKWLVTRNSQSALVWFNVKKLLQTLNRYGSPSSSDDQTFQLAGYPCRAHAGVDYVDGRKMLGVYIGTSRVPNTNPEWPMKRRITITIHGADGATYLEDDIGTTDPEAGDYFRGPNSAGSYGISDICSIEELTNEHFYRRNNGMICVSFEAALL